MDMVAATGGRLPPAPLESISIRANVLAGAIAGLALLIWTGPGLALSLCAGATTPVPVATDVNVGEVVTTEVTEAPAPAAADAAQPTPKEGRACAEVDIAGHTVAAVLVTDRAVPRPKPGAAYAGPTGFAVPEGTTDRKLRVDLYFARGAETRDRAQFDCSRTIIGPDGSADGPVAVACEARAIASDANGFRASSFTLGLWRHADEAKGLWQVRIDLRDQLSGGKAALLLAYPFGAAGQ